MKKRARVVLCTLSALVVLTILAGVAGWMFYKKLRNPARYLARARECVEAGQHEAAMDQFRRAYSRTKQSGARVDIQREMIRVLQSDSPLPPDKAAARQDAIMALAMDICRNDRANTAARRQLLDIQFNIAQQVRNRHAWQQLGALAELLADLGASDAEVRLHRAVGHLMADPKHTTEAVFHETITTELEMCLEASPHDWRVAYFLSIADLHRASASRSETVSARMARLALAALNRSTAFLEAHPGDHLAALGNADIQVRAAHLLDDPARHADLCTAIRHAFTLLEKADAAPARFIELARIADSATRWRTGEEVPVAPSAANASEPQAALPEALAILEAGTKRHPGDPRILLEYAGALQDRGQTAEARACLLRAISNDPIAVNPDARLILSAQSRSRYLLADLELDRCHALADPRERAEAIAGARGHVDALGADNKQILAYIGLVEGRIAYHEGRCREAVRTLVAAGEHLDPPPPALALHLGLSLAQLGEIGAAARQLTAYLATSHQRRHRSLATRELASCAIELRNYERALECLRELLEDAPADPELAVLFARAVNGIVAMQGDEDGSLRSEARELLRPLAESGNRRAIYELARLYELMGDWGAARPLFARLCESPTAEDASALLHLYHGLRQAGHPPEAVQALRAALGGQTDDEAATLLLETVENDPSLGARGGDLVGVVLQSKGIRRSLGLVQYYRETGAQQDADRLMLDTLSHAQAAPLVLRAAFDQALSQNNVTQAQQFLDRYAESDPDSGDLASCRARLLIAREELSQALVLLQKSVRRNPYRSEFHVLLAQAYRMQGEFFKAIQSGRQAVLIDPLRPDVWRFLIRVHDQRGDHGAALEEMRRALVFMPRDNQLKASFIQYLTAHGDPRDALALRERMARMNPADQDNRRALAELYRRSGQFDRAESVLDKLLREAPGSFANHLAMARFEAEGGRHNEGRQRLETFVQTHGDTMDSEGWLGYARFLHGLGESEEALEATRQAAELDDSESSRSRKLLASLHLQRQEAGEALKIYSELPEDQLSGRDRLRMAQAQYYQGKHGDALHIIRNIEAEVDQKPRRLDTLKAEILLAMDRPGEATLAAEQAIAADSSDAHAHFLRAKVNRSSDVPEVQEQVLRDLAKAVSLAPTRVQPRLFLMDWYARNGRFEEAITQARRILDLSPKTSEFWQNLASLYLQTDHVDPLATLLREWEHQLPNDLARLRFQAELADRQDRPADAAAAWNQVISQTKTPRRATVRGYLAALLRAGHRERVIEFMGREPYSEMNEPHLLALHGRAHAAGGNTDRATELFLAALAAAGDDMAAAAFVLQAADKALTADVLAALLEDAGACDGTGLAAVRRAQGHLLEGGSEEAIKQLEALRSRLGPAAPARGHVLRVLAASYHLNGVWPKAEAVYREALALSPDDPSILNDLAYGLAENDQNAQEAVRLAERAVNTAGDTSRATQALYLDTLGFAQYKADLHSLARHNLRRSIDLKRLPANTYHLGLVHLAEQDLASAREILNTAAKLVDASSDAELAADIAAALRKIEK